MKRQSTHLDQHLLYLRFLGTETAELIGVRFLSPLLNAPLVCARGQYPQTTQTTGSFTWSRGVQALCLLLIEYQLRKLGGEFGPTDYLLRGYRGSLASALDSAVSKQPNWVFDMFGADAQGGAMLRRILIRDNPELKRPGPVAIGMSRSWWQSLNLHVFHEEDNITLSIQRLSQLSQNILKAYPSMRVVGSSVHEFSSGDAIEARTCALVSQG